MVEVKFNHLELADSCSSQAQLNLVVWRRLIDAGIPLPTFSPLRDVEQQFTATRGVMVKFSENFETTFQWDE